MRGVRAAGLALAVGLALPAQGRGEGIVAEARTAEALRKAALAAIDSGEFAPPARRTALYARAAALADSAVLLAPADAESRVVKAIAAGRSALSEPPRERVRYAVMVRDEATHALRLNPDHPGALHVLGMWHAEVLRLPVIARFAARTLLGAKVFGEADWEVAERSLARSVALEPEVIVHRLDYAGILADRGKRDAARAQYEWIVRAVPREHNDPRYQQQAAERLGRR